MKTALACLALFALLTGSLHAAVGSDNIIKQRAKEIRDQNNVRQGVAAPTQQPQPGAPATPAPTPLSQGATRLQSDLATIQADATITPEFKQKLANDITATAQGGKPTPEAATKLAASLSAAFATKPLSATSRARLVQELDALLNPGKYPQAKPDAIYTDIQAIFQDNGLERKKAVALVEDVKAAVPK